MTTIVKKKLVEDLASVYNASGYVFIVNVKGLEANKNNTIRKQIIDNGAKAFVIKNTLNKIAASATNHSCVVDCLKGQNMSVFANDPVSIAKILVDVSKGDDSGVALVGVSDGKVFYGPDYIKTFATMPSLDVIRASLLSVIQSVPRKIAYSLSYCPASITRVISSNFENK